MQRLVWHSEPSVHESPGGVRQVFVLPDMQVPDPQESPPVQGSPSSQDVPSGAGSSVGQGHTPGSADKQLC